MRRYNRDKAYQSTLSSGGQSLKRIGEAKPTSTDMKDWPNASHA